MSEFEVFHCDQCEKAIGYIDGDINAAIICQECYWAKLERGKRKRGEES